MTASAQELSRAKAAFKSMLKLRRCAELLQQIHGNNVFGLAAFTDSLIGGPIARTDPFTFLAVAAMSRLHPQLVDTMIDTGKSLDAALDALGQQVAKRDGK
jgi:hypothetical protein